MAVFSADLDKLFVEVPFLERFKLAQENGFDGAEFTYDEKIPLGKLGDCASYKKLKTVLISMPKEWSKNAFLTNKRKDFIEKIDKMIDVADFLECKMIYVPGIVFKDGEYDFEELQDNFCKSLHAVAEKLKHNKIKLLVGITERNSIEENVFPENTLDLSSILETLDDNKAFGMLYDVALSQMAEGNISMAIDTYAEIINHVRIAGVPSMNEPDYGELNYSYIVSLLEQVSYSGKIGCSYLPRAKTIDGLKWMKRYV
ncbi:MAG: TIM barrel protein [Alphaproteobacteria bacterium]|nr:TIM barrel protein [Alphaproteobacteria bacterium]